MDNWQAWATVAVGFMLTIIGNNARLEKRRAEENFKELFDKHNDLNVRLAKVEANLMSEKEVREVLKEYFDGFFTDMKKMQQDVHAINLKLAQMPKRETDKR